MPTRKVRVRNLGKLDVITQQFNNKSINSTISTDTATDTTNVQLKIVCRV